MLYLMAWCWAILGATEPAPLRVVLPSDQVVKVTTGETFEVVLEGNITTGYAWSVTHLPKGLVQVGEVKYLNPTVTPGEPRRVGRGGQFVFTFQAKLATQGAVKFAYARPWEKDVPPAATAVLNFISSEK
jgi:predicted secreted protein